MSRSTRRFDRNYADEMTRGLGRIEVKPTQTGYFMPEEYKAVIDATYAYSDRHPHFYADPDAHPRPERH